LQKASEHATAESKIRKPVTLHWLRHSYATHFLEAVTDFRFKRELPGHKSSKTKEMCTHVHENSLQKIKILLDNLLKFLLF